MDLTLILARLKAQLSGLKSVGTSADLDTAIEGAVALPAAFLLPLAERATASDLTGSTSQRITQAFAVLHVVSNRRDALGSAALSDLVPLRARLRAALVGWVPDAETGEPVHYSAGRLLQLDHDGRLWWLDEFELVTYFWST